MNIFSIPIVASTMTFIILFLLFFYIYHSVKYIFSKKKIISKIRRAHEDTSRDAESVTGFIQGSHKENVATQFFKRIGTIAIRDSAPSYGIMRVRFLQAGIQDTNAVFIFWGIKLISTFCFTTLFLAIEFQFHLVTQRTVTAGIALGIALAGFYLPDMWLSIRTNRRKETLARAFPDALDLMVVCVEAGVGLDSSFNRVAKEFSLTNQELCKEFQMVNRELRAGKSRKDALENLARRTGLDEIKNFAGLMIQTLKFGTSIKQALQLYAYTFRNNRMQKAEEMAAKLPVKLTIPAALFIFPSLLVVILGPAAIRIIQQMIPTLGG